MDVAGRGAAPGSAAGWSTAMGRRSEATPFIKCCNWFIIHTRGGEGERQGGVLLQAVDHVVVAQQARLQPPAHLATAVNDC